MKKLFLTGLLLCGLFAASCNGQNGTKETEVLLQTTAGDIRVKLYNDTPGHRDNFIQNVKAGMYDDVAFHRVIRNFMIQTGDPDTRTGDFPKVAPEDSMALGPTIPAEIVYPTHYHRRGVLAAAREGDENNPQKASDKFQFYIVTGKFQNEEQLVGYEDAKQQARIVELYQQKVQEHAEELEALRRAREQRKYENRLSDLRTEAQMEIDETPPVRFTAEQKRIYRSQGGAPWLDGDYTVFGEVVQGMKVVLDIEKTRTDKSDRPLRDIRIVKATVLE